MNNKIQSVIIPKEKFTLKQSHKWLMKHNYKIPVKVDETENFYRYRQRNPDKRYTYTTKVLPNGVELILMWKRELKGSGKDECKCDDKLILINDNESLTNKEDDEIYGVFGDHIIRKKLEPVRSKAKELLGREVTDWIYNNYKWFFETFNYSK
jgi:hypothetical protein